LSMQVLDVVFNLHEMLTPKVGARRDESCSVFDLATSWRLTIEWPGPGFYHAVLHGKEKDALLRQLLSSSPVSPPA